MKKLLKLSNLHLSISTIIVASISIVYGFKPEFLFNITVQTIDEFNILKAIMGLYLAFSSIWIIGIYFKKY